MKKLVAAGLLSLVTTTGVGMTGVARADSPTQNCVEIETSPNVFACVDVMDVLDIVYSTTGLFPRQSASSIWVPFVL